MHMNRVTSSQFYEVLLRYVFRVYHTMHGNDLCPSDPVWVMPPRLRTLHSRATVLFDRVDNMTDNLQEEIS
jgi:hypothetical protein